MRIAALMFCFWAAAALADTPATSASDKALGVVQAGYAGTWNIDETDFLTDFSRAATKQYQLTRDCMLAGALLDCKLLAAGIQQGEQRFFWDAASNSYRVEMDVGTRSQPALTLTVNGSSWTFLQDLPGPGGKPMQLRIQRQYHSASEVSYSVSYSHDGQNWTSMSHGTEILQPAAK